MLSHAKVVALVVSVILPLGVVQEVLGTVIEVTVGFTVLLITVAAAADVQPFASVVVTLYVPAAKPTWFLVAGKPPLHTKLVPLVLNVISPVNVPVQLVLGLVVAVIVGLSVLFVTVAEVIVVQEPAPVMVTVYVPADKPA